MLELGFYPQLRPRRAAGYQLAGIYRLHPSSCAANRLAVDTAQGRFFTHPVLLSACYSLSIQRNLPGSAQWIDESYC